MAIKQASRAQRGKALVQFEMVEAEVQRLRDYALLEERPVSMIVRRIVQQWLREQEA